MKFAFSSDNSMDFDRKELLSSHDVVFRAPVPDPAYGLPIGNGDSGCLLWVTPDALHVQINKTDLWDDSKTDDGCCCSMEHENLTVCRHGAELVWDLSCPAFETIYQNRFEARLSLYDASAYISADTPFCKSSFSAFSSEAGDVSVICAEIEAANGSIISFEREYCRNTDVKKLGNAILGTGKEFC